MVSPASRRRAFAGGVPSNRRVTRCVMRSPARIVRGSERSSGVGYVLNDGSVQLRWSSSSNSSPSNVSSATTSSGKRTARSVNAGIIGRNMSPCRSWGAIARGNVPWTGPSSVVAS